ncbi:hypothetical protein N8389_05950, partial [Flavobacteriaceae bacterium]|nr:hypothetical protein [Flavobacteriaceae bacterium]
LFVFLAIKRDELTLEEKHYYFLEKSPFKNTKKLSRKARKALGIPPTYGTTLEFIVMSWGAYFSLYASEVMNYDEIQSANLGGASVILKTFCLFCFWIFG